MSLSKVVLYIISPIVFTCNSPRPVDVNAVDHSRVLKQADGFLNQPPVTITSFPAERSAGGIHDFYSEGDYWWPDPADPDGPYIRRDGMTNPDNFTRHREVMRRFSIQVPALVAAFILTGEKKYSTSAIRHLRAWFVNADTRMNPDLRFGQAIKGRVTGRGIGIIDTIHLVEIARSVQMLEKYQGIDDDDLQTIKNWFAAYLEWMTTDEFGISERDNGNNHSTCWAMQVAAFSDLTGNEDIKTYTRNFYKTVLIPEQMATSGSFPKELKRTKPYNYSLFNLDALVMVCQILSTVQDDLWHFSTPDGRNIKLAVDFMFPYIRDKSKWPYPPDVMYYDLWPVRQPSLLFAGIAFHNMAYIDVWKDLDPDPENEEVIRNYPIRQPILWLN
jgi:hypothetical protein